MIFCKTKKHLKKIQTLLIPIFENFYKEVDFHNVYSGKKNNQKILEHFENSNKPQVIFCVDMLNEGIHIKNTDTIMMFRDTSSPIIYFQQLGRGFSAGRSPGRGFGGRGGGRGGRGRF